MFIQSFLRCPTSAQLTLLMSMSMAMAVSGCSEPECPEGLIKVGKSCKRPDAGAMLVSDAEGPTFEAGADPTLTADAGGSAGSADASSFTDATSSSDGASSANDAASSSTDGQAGSDGGALPEAGAGGDANTPVEAGADSGAGSCAAGYVLQSGACQDIDECFEGTHQCHMTSTCKNTAGSYDCECPLGFSGGTSAGFACAPRIAVGERHACVLLSDGHVQCWGDNSSGQLGDGTQTARPIPVTVGGLTDAAVITAGANHSCAILRDQTVRCWGNNTDGVLGDGSTMNRASPVVVPRLDDVVAIDSGWHSCVVQKSGSMKCWGPNVKGQLGTGVASEPALSPVGVAGVSLAANVFLGYTQTCAILRTRAAPCWGEGYLAVTGTTTNLNPVELPLPGTVRSLAFGYRHACSLQGDGKVYCWGTSALVGTGTTGADVPPTEVPGPKAKGLAIAFYGTYALRQDGSLSWWHLGTAPTNAPGIAGAVAVDALFNQGCVILDDGTVTCWTLTNPTAGAVFNGPVQVSGIDLW